MKLISALTLPIMLCTLACATGRESHTAITKESNRDRNASSRSLPESPAIAVPEADRSVFGRLETNAEGRSSIVSASELSNVTGDSCGWIIWVGQSEYPVEWIETITAPGPVAWRVDDTSSVSADGRTVTTRKSTVPDRGFVHDAWVLTDGDPPGPYDIRISFPGSDRPEERFAFVLGEPLGRCPYRLVHLNWYFAELSEQGDPHKRDLSADLLARVAIRLTQHGFQKSDLPSAYWQLEALVSRRLDDPTAFGVVMMRAIAGFDGKAIRAARQLTTSKQGTSDFQILFELPVDQIDAEADSIADTLAAKLSPHARLMCEDWVTGHHAEEARLERIRQELVAEIEKVRRERRERSRQHKMLEIDPDAEPR